MQTKTLRDRIEHARFQIDPYLQKIVRSGLVHLVSANLFNQAIGFISSLFVVRFLIPEELGETRIIGTYVGYVQLLGTLGLSTSILTFLPRSSDHIARRWWLQVTLLLVVVATTIVAIFSAWISSHGWLMTNARTAYWYRWSLLGTVATSSSGILIAFYQAEHNVKKLAGIQTVVRVLVLIIVVGGTWIGGFQGYIVAVIAGAFLMLGGLMAVLPRSQGTIHWEHLPIGYTRVAGLALLANVIWTIGRTVDVVVIDRFTSNRAQFGCYALATSIAMLTTLMISIVQVIAIPYFSANHLNAKWVLLNAKKWQKAGTLLASFGAVAVYFAATLIVRFIYGHAYSEAILFLIPILLAQCLLATFHIQSAALIGMNLVSVNTMTAALVVPLSVLVTIILARQYGAWGCAWAQVISAGIYAGLQYCLGWSALIRKTLIQENIHV